MRCAYHTYHVILDVGCQSKYSRTGGDIMSGKCPESVQKMSGALIFRQFRQLIIFGELKNGHLKYPLRQIPLRIF